MGRLSLFEIQYTMLCCMLSLFLTVWWVCLSMSGANIDCKSAKVLASSISETLATEQWLAVCKPNVLQLLIMVYVGPHVCPPDGAFSVCSFLLDSDKALLPFIPKIFYVAPVPVGSLFQKKKLPVCHISQPTHIVSVLPRTKNHRQAICKKV